MRVAGTSAQDADGEPALEVRKELPSGLRVRPYRPADDGDWDELVGRAVNGTFLHTRRYLSYHGDRFLDRSFVLEDREGRLLAVLPAAEQSETLVTSHPGITYGGLVHAGGLGPGVVTDVIEQVAAELHRAGYEHFRYKAVPHIYHRVPAEEDLYALRRLGAAASSDLSCGFPLASRRRPSHGRRYGVKLAVRRGVEVVISWDRIEEFWGTLRATLGERHEAAPVHALEEICLLNERFPDEILLCCGLLEGAVVAGAVLYCAGPVVHTQYLAASPEGRKVSALDLVIESSIELAGARGALFFDFGISNVGHGGPLNTSLHDYKASFGSGAVTYEEGLLELKAGSS